MNYIPSLEIQELTTSSFNPRRTMDMTPESEKAALQLVQDEEMLKTLRENMNFDQSEISPAVTVVRQEEDGCDQVEGDPNN